MGEPLTDQWTREAVYFEGDDFYNALTARMAQAQRSIYIEVYIFENDALGKRIIELLVEARKRGIDVRIVVDGVGASGWVGNFGALLKEAHVHYKVYHQLPWEKLRYEQSAWRRLKHIPKLFGSLNKRNHRKVWIIDEKEAWVGSMNVTHVHCASLHGSEAWRDTGVCVEGAGVNNLLEAFHTLWLTKPKRAMRYVKRKLRMPGTERALPPSQLVRLNSSRKQRRNNYRDLLRRIRSAEKRIFITTSYFVPHGSLLRALSHASSKGVDVRIVVPRTSDLFFMPWVISCFYEGLLKARVKLFEYKPRFIHAKSLIIDDWYLVGSSNLNHRSLIHDLEADIVVTGAMCQQQLLSQFQEDVRHSETVTTATWQSRPLLTKLLGKTALLFQRML